MKHLLMALISLALWGCVGSKSALPNPSGRAGEILIVMNDSDWKNPSGELLQSTLTQDVAGLAWSEPVFDLSRLPHAVYNDMVRIARNVIEVDVGNRYAVAKVKFFKEKYSRTQAYVNIQAPDEASLYRAIKENDMKLLSFFYNAERERLMDYFAKNKNEKYQEKVEELIGYKITIPALLNHHNLEGQNFLWFSGGKVEARTDVLMYTFPCASEDLISMAYLRAKRDSVMKINVPGPSEGAYVRTADVVEPTFNKIKINNSAVYEMRGLWETTVDFMGGPFVNYTYYDKENKMVKVLEGFVYAPNEDKRNLIRRIEAVAYSWQPSQEANKEQNE